MDAHDLLKDMLKGMGIPEQEINDAIAGPSLKTAQVGLNPIAVAGPPSKASIEEAKAQVEAANITVEQVWNIPPEMVEFPGVGAPLPPGSYYIKDPTPVAVQAKPKAKAPAPEPEPEPTNGKYTNLKPKKEWNIVEANAVATDANPTPAATNDPLITADTPEFEFTFQAKPVVVRVRAATPEQAEQRAGSLFDPLGAEWELVK